MAPSREPRSQGVLRFGCATMCTGHSKHASPSIVRSSTSARAVPVWPGMGPWHQAAAQFSYHEARSDGSYSQVGWLAEGPEDARPILARRMVEATAKADHVVMYTPFERTRIRALQRAVPELESELLDLEHKLVDLHPIVRDYVYHPDFKGSFSIKNVLQPRSGSSWHSAPPHSDPQLRTRKTVLDS